MEMSNQASQDQLKSLQPSPSIIPHIYDKKELSPYNNYLNVPQATSRELKNDSSSEFLSHNKNNYNDFRNRRKLSDWVEMGGCHE
jgi:hypothetical protein